MNCYQPPLAALAVQDLQRVPAVPVVRCSAFCKKDKLAPRYVGPFEMIKRIGPVAYRLRFLQELSSIHDTFHVSNLKKCLADANLHVSLEEIKVDKTLCFVEEPIDIMDREVKWFKRSRIPIVNVHCNSKTREAKFFVVEMIKFWDEISLSGGYCDTRDQTRKWSLSLLDDPPNSNFFGPKHNLVKRAITVPRTTRAQLLKDPNKLYVDDIRPDLKGWELIFKENFFCSIDKRNKVKACTAYMLYYLTIGRKFNFTSMIIYRMEEVIKKCKGPMTFAMLLTRLYKHILTTNPQAIVPLARFTFHELVMDPLDISRNPSKEKGKKIASPSVITSSSSSSNDNEAPSFLMFYNELSDSEDLTKAQ
ncbi:hypothetical protein Tco_1326553 [Tanacetum coccineum]